MKVQLLLLSALVGLLCAFTSANPITDPTELHSSSVVVTEEEAATGVTLGANPTPVVTGHPPSEPTAVHFEITTHVFNDHMTVPVPTTEALVTETEAPNTSTQYAEYTSEETTSSTEQVLSESQTDDLTETMGSTGTVIPADTEGIAERVGPVGTETTDLIIEDPEEALSSGQIVGIVVGALLAVAVIIAVVIVVLKRMGEYSP
ncbi:podoplanin isoform X2 [Neolamprologus brichardi]|uniref:podoplanin isoform X2 n=1 Tax=Neolamprologus brichardi TaxID=32507 RepID=UPI001643A2FC|nr:podoplanin isoform X2 [Neolamprologus brichardi]